MTNHQMTSKDFLVGAAVGSVLGTVSALLIAPKSGKRLRRNLYDMCCDITDKTNDTACQMSKKSRSLMKNFGSQTADWTDRAKEKVEDIKDWMHPEEEECCTTTTSIISGVAGGLLMGAIAGLLLAPKAGTDLRDDIADTYDDISDRTHDFVDQFSKKSKKTAQNVGSQASDWMELAKEVLDRFVGDAQDTAEDVVERGRTKLQAGSDRINNIMEWASLGLRVWQGIKKRG